MVEAIQKVNTALSGIKMIRAFCGSIGLPSSEVSVMRMIRYDGLPAKQLGKIWESDKELIMAWRKDRITGETEAKLAPDPRLPVKQRTAKTKRMGK